MLTTVPFCIHPARRKPLCRPRKLCRDLVSLYARGHLGEPQEVLELVTTKLLCSSDAKLIFKAAFFLTSQSCTHTLDRGINIAKWSVHTTVVEGPISPVLSRKTDDDVFSTSANLLMQVSARHWKNRWLTVNQSVSGTEQTPKCKPLKFKLDMGWISKSFGNFWKTFTVDLFTEN